MRNSLKKACVHLHKNIGNGKIYVGKNCWISKKAVLDLTGNIYLGNNVIISENAKLYTHYHDHSGRWIEFSENNTHIKNKQLFDGVFLYECIITANCHLIAEGVVIGAGSVVTKPITEPYTIWAGNPARKIKDR